ncbi:MAG: VacJ family lipoprotein [Candidatus Accumulibacter sp.]|jgi:phospholipid-binding lipoprotein MlaA|nr:VacJ family lipoprotein [Accumulibacter sp.]
MKRPGVKRCAAALATCAAMAGPAGCVAADNPGDPFEGFNRVMFSVNEGIDVVVKPVAQGYDAIVPGPVRTGIGNFFGNIADVWTAVNNLLQGKITEGASDTARVLVNSTMGIVGLIDVASHLGLEKHTEDFGQTLGKWGVGEGPYLYWPIVGPSNVRDTIGFAADMSADPIQYIHDVRVRNSLDGVRLIDARASLLPTDKVIEAAAFDKYSYIRNAYFQMRRDAVYDGDPPPLEDDEDDGEENEK